jgi:hypothetical protein
MIFTSSISNTIDNKNFLVLKVLFIEGEEHGVGAFSPRCGPFDGRLVDQVLQSAACLDSQRSLGSALSSLLPRHERFRSTVWHQYGQTSGTQGRDRCISGTSSRKKLFSHIDTNIGWVRRKNINITLSLFCFISCKHDVTLSTNVILSVFRMLDCYMSSKNCLFCYKYSGH